VSSYTRCDACGRAVPRELSLHFCVPLGVADFVQRLPFPAGPLPTARTEIPHASSAPQSYAYVPEWAEKL
jgi:hypothetical protein